VRAGSRAESAWLWGDRALETGIDQHAALAEITAAAGLVEGQGSPDLSGHPRFWKARRKTG
jgi:hypothetical protein